VNEFVVGESVDAQLLFESSDGHKLVVVEEGATGDGLLPSELVHHFERLAILQHHMPTAACNHQVFVVLREIHCNNVEFILYFVDQFEILCFVQSGSARGPSSHHPLEILRKVDRIYVGSILEFVLVD